MVPAQDAAAADELEPLLGVFDGVDDVVELVVGVDEDVVVELSPDLGVDSFFGSDFSAFSALLVLSALLSLR